MSKWIMMVVVVGVLAWSLSPPPKVSHNISTWKDGPAKTVLMPLPESGFDPTEAAVPWGILKEAGHNVVFATPAGKPSAADPHCLDGILGGIYQKQPEDLRQIYDRMIESQEFRNPISYADITADGADAWLIVGGHNPNMETMLDSESLQASLRQFWATEKPVAAVCHGVLLATRTIDPATKKSIVHDYKLTTVPAFLERIGWAITTYIGGMGDYQLSTTHGGYVETEVRGAVAAGNFERGPVDVGAAVMVPTRDNHRRAYIVEDRQLLTARFWGDAHLFGLRLAAKLSEV